jgi:hypothetical protein
MTFIIGLAGLLMGIVNGALGSWVRKKVAEAMLYPLGVLAAGLMFFLPAILVGAVRSYSDGFMYLTGFMVGGFLTGAAIKHRSGRKDSSP